MKVQIEKNLSVYFIKFSIDLKTFYVYKELVCYC